MVIDRLGIDMGKDQELLMGQAIKVLTDAGALIIIIIMSKKFLWIIMQSLF